MRPASRTECRRGRATRGWIAGLAGLAVLTGPLFASDARTGPPSQLRVVVSTESFCVGSTNCTQRLLLAWFVSSRRAPRHLKATLDLPEWLGLGPSIPLQTRNIDRRQASHRPPVLHYWGTWTTPPPSQPVFEETQRSLESAWPRGCCGRPDDPRLGSLGVEARAAGRYTLHAGKLGETTLTLGEGQDFLEPLRILEPAAEQATVDATRPFALKWAPPPRTIGHAVVVRGKARDGRPALWETSRDVHFACLSTSPQQALQEARLLPAEQTSCTVPGGIFSGSITITVTAYSSEARTEGAFSALGWAQSTHDHEIMSR